MITTSITLVVLLDSLVSVFSVQQSVSDDFIELYDFSENMTNDPTSSTNRELDQMRLIFLMQKEL